MYQPKHLKLWTMPDNYFGKVWPGYYPLLGQSRDSSALERSNFTQGLAELGGESETVVVVRESHWAVGWVEWIGIHQDDEAALRKADDMKSRLEGYPVLDEEHFSDLEFNEACQWWHDMGLRSRVDACKRCGVSIFAARRADELPQDENGSLLEYLRGD